MKATSLSRKLLTRVLSFYFVLTFIVTCVQIGAEYINTKNHIANELLTLEKTFSGSLTRAVWELNTQQAVTIAEGLVAIPMIKGITITDENNQLIAQLGISADKETLFLESIDDEDNNRKYFNVTSHGSGLFGHGFPLIFEFSGRTTRVGSVTLLSSNEVIFNRIQVGIYFLIGNAMVKTAALVLLFSLAFSSLLTNPLNELTEQINQFDIDDPEASKLHVINYENNELNILQNAYNNLIDELVAYKEKLALAQTKVITANSKLDEQNLMLEQEVARKTSSLSTTMLKMEMQQRELLDQQAKLQAENSRRSMTEKTLLETNHELKSSIIALKKAQERLLDAEKMAVLGSMSAEVTHEINTPIGVSITSTSYLADLLTKLKLDIEQNKLSKRVLNDFTEHSEQGLNLVLNNLERASELVSSYKQVAADQISEKIRQINLAKYIDEIIHSLQPKLKKTNHSIKVDCPDDAEIYCHAGAISQIFTNLIINSVIHGFKDINHGEITILVKINGQHVHVIYQDNGHGVSDEQLIHLFDPFYTTAGNRGGTGLGTHIVHNLVNDTLNGSVSASSTLEKGLIYDIKFDNLR
ncbi:HAMP domain-containing sensor histidine kinase [Colwellia sp. PAMC 21821]|uniref:sensor histidine kinase n=1 Tax=Colwellia sp. PAMC 21821 TaxID=1816219 RepID=UPI0009BFB691|nr:HAMP domain-containing sensor histidine kinase [Colwellia sp. PAMC 21821]ARD45043.1 histidine kinase [Colwellia sp. PAMC 21821]